MVLLHNFRNEEALLVSGISLRSKYHTVVFQRRTGYRRAVIIYKMRSAWVAVTNIRKGEKIQKRMIVKKMIPERDFPNGVVEFRWLILGKRPE